MDTNSNPDQHDMRRKPPAELDRMFDDPAQHETLRDYFGPKNFLEIQQFHERAKTVRARGVEKVYILPGIMASELAVADGGETDTVWLDYWRIFRGRLFELALDQNRTVDAVDVLTNYYYKILKAVQAAGFLAEYYPFDWRLSIKDLGQQLAQKVAAERNPVRFVAHSMGGLVCRAALAPGMPGQDKVLSAVQLGTPNFGSYSPVLAFRGTHDIARKVELLDIEHNMDEYRDHLFMGFPGLYDMLPSPGKTGSADIFDPQNWPPDGHLPHEQELRRARDYQQSLYTGDGRFFLIAGVEQDTIVGARSEGGEFLYSKSDQGDGTVPLACCLLPSAKTYYVAEEHGALPNNLSVCEAVCDLLHTGTTAKLPDHWDATAARALPVAVTDSQLRQKPVDLDIRNVDDNQRRSLLKSGPSSGAAPALLNPDQDKNFLEGFVPLGHRTSGRQ